jgi:plastocyanin
MRSRKAAKSHYNENRRIQMTAKNNKRIRAVITLLAAVIGLVLLAACSSAAKTTLATTQPATTSSAAGNAVTIDLSASGMAFDTKTIKVPAGAKVTINFQNKDSANHNFAAYLDAAAANKIFVGEVIGTTSIIYTFTAPTNPGTYFFRCDVHPSIMKGSFIVE